MRKITKKTKKIKKVKAKNKTRKMYGGVQLNTIVDEAFRTLSEDDKRLLGKASGPNGSTFLGEKTRPERHPHIHYSNIFFGFPGGKENHISFSLRAKASYNKIQEIRDISLKKFHMDPPLENAYRNLFNKMLDLLLVEEYGEQDEGTIEPNEGTKDPSQNHAIFWWWYFTTKEPEIYDKPSKLAKAEQLTSAEKDQLYAEFEQEKKQIILDYDLQSESDKYYYNELSREIERQTVSTIKVPRTRTRHNLSSKVTSENFTSPSTPYDIERAEMESAERQSIRDAKKEELAKEEASKEEATKEQHEQTIQKQKKLEELNRIVLTERNKLYNFCRKHFPLNKIQQLSNWVETKSDLPDKIPLPTLYAFLKLNREYFETISKLKEDFLSINRTLSRRDSIGFIDVSPYETEVLLTSSELLKLFIKLQVSNNQVTSKEYSLFVNQLVGSQAIELNNSEIKNLIFKEPIFTAEEIRKLKHQKEIDGEEEGKLACKSFKYFWLSELFTNLIKARKVITETLVTIGTTTLGTLPGDKSAVEKIQEQYGTLLISIVDWCRYNVEYFETYFAAKEDGEKENILIEIKKLIDENELVGVMMELSLLKQKFYAFQETYGLSITNIDEFVSPLLRSGVYATHFKFANSAETRLKKDLENYKKKGTHSLTPEDIEILKRGILLFIEKNSIMVGQEFYISKEEAENYHLLKDTSAYSLKLFNVVVHTKLMDEFENKKETYLMIQKENDRIDQEKSLKKSKSKLKTIEEERSLSPEEMSALEKDAEEKANQLLLEEELSKQGRKGGNKITKKQKRGNKITKKRKIKK